MGKFPYERVPKGEWANLTSEFLRGMGSIMKSCHCSTSLKLAAKFWRKVCSWILSFSGAQMNETQEFRRIVMDAVLRRKVFVVLKVTLPKEVWRE